MMHRILLLVALLMLVACTSRAADAPLPLAVFDFQGSDDASRELAPKLSALLNVELSQDERFLMVERAELEKVLGEQELGLSGTVSEATAPKLGQLTGAKLLVTGRVMKLENDTLVVVKLISTETSRVFAEKAEFPAGGSPAAPIGELAKKLGALAATQRAALLAKTEDPAERIAALRRAIAGKRLPVISVAIPEQHFGRPVIDPAAETELNLLLHACGFPLVDGKSQSRPELEIGGEAFSERGFQKGALIGCRARVEIKVRQVADGAVLAADRQVGLAADLAEHVAAKSALQAAARQLAERIIPTLAR